jgi:hypothetical protein
MVKSGLSHDAFFVKTDLLVGSYTSRIVGVNAQIDAVEIQGVETIVGHQLGSLSSMPLLPTICFPDDDTEFGHPIDVINIV